MRKAMVGVTLVLGGVRSGKSRLAESVIQAEPSPWVYIATGQALDEDMAARIAAHQARRDARWHTLNAPLAVSFALDEAGPRPVLVDCLTLWLTNLILDCRDLETETCRLLEALHRRSAKTVLVSNEVGMGIVPDHALGRRFRDAAGVLHQRIAAEAERVLFVAAGLPIALKGTLNETV